MRPTPTRHSPKPRKPKVKVVPRRTREELETENRYLRDRLQRLNDDRPDY